MPSDPHDVIDAASRLRNVHSDLLAGMRVDRVVESLSALAETWRSPRSPWRRRAASIPGCFGLAAVSYSLDALLKSLSPVRLYALLEAEGVFCRIADAPPLYTRRKSDPPPADPNASPFPGGPGAREGVGEFEQDGLCSKDGRRGYPLVGHVIAGNTPLLVWVSCIRALLVCSTSLVKLPSNSFPEGVSASERSLLSIDGRSAGRDSAVALWAELFHDSLASVDPGLASSIEMLQWSGSVDGDSNAALCDACDLVVVYGADAAIDALRALRGDRPFLGYGHRLSVAVVPEGSDIAAAAQGTALDVLLYDQCGCLSPHAVYVEGPVDRAAAFADALAAALEAVVSTVPAAERTESSASAIRRARSLASMEPNVCLKEDPGLRWTVVLRESPEFVVSPSHGVVSVHSIESPEAFKQAMAGVDGLVQGCSIAPAGGASDNWRAAAVALGATYLCAPGALQTPPLEWRQDGIPVLVSLVPRVV